MGGEPGVSSGANDVTAVQFQDKNQSLSNVLWTVEIIGDNDGDTCSRTMRRRGWIFSGNPRLTRCAKPLRQRCTSCAKLHTVRAMTGNGEVMS